MLSAKLATLLEGLKKNSKIHEVQVKSDRIVQQTHVGMDLVSKKLKKARLVLEKRDALKKARLHLQNSKKTTDKGVVNDPESQMSVVVCTDNDPMDHPYSRESINYRLQGDNSTKQISDWSLHQRLKQIFDPRQNVAILNVSCSQEYINQQVQSSSSMDEDSDDRRALRYFEVIDQSQQQSRIVKCYRCGKRGHLAKNCLQEKDRCIYCLKEHNHHGCNSRVCFRCSEMGHVSQECTAGWIKCHRCGKRGHVEQTCGSVLFLDYAEFKPDHQLRNYFREDVNKLKCLSNCRLPHGHFNCFQYSDKRWKPYQSAEMFDKESSRQVMSFDQNLLSNAANIYVPCPYNEIPQQRNGMNFQRYPQPNHSNYNHEVNGRYRNNLKPRIFKPRQQYNKTRKW